MAAPADEYALALLLIFEKLISSGLFSFRLVDPTLPANNAAFERHVKTGKVPAA